ncbi:MAG: flagellar biosynthetic protein FliR [Thermotoga sp.]|nr:MAG: flagellar biosynthetic protein FliR [Thermotoga sp.]
MPHDVVNFLENKFLVWCLVISRISGLFIVGPLFSTAFIPAIVKILIILFLSWLVTPSIESFIPLDTPIIEIFLMSLSNFIVGLLAGLIANALLTAVAHMGEIFGIQLGFGVAEVFDPQTMTQTPLVSQFTYLMAVYIFTLMKGPNMILIAILKSFDDIPINFTDINFSTFENIARIGSQIFRIGLRFGMPLVVFMVVVSFILGILSKLMPQMNIFMIGLPVKILVGLVLFAGVFPILADAITKLSFSIIGEVRELLTHLR